MAPRRVDRQRLLAASLGIAVFLIPLYPAFIALTGAPVPGIAVLPEPLTVALLAVCGAIALLWIVELMRGPRRREPTVLALTAFPAAALLAALLGFDPAAGALFVAILAGGVLWHAAILTFARDEATLRTVFGAFLLSGALAALAAIAMVLAKTPVALYTIGHGRATGTFILPGELAGYLIVYVPVAFALARTVPALRPLALAGLALGAVAFAMTFSRAGFVGMAAAIAALVLMRRRRGARYAVAIVGAAVVVIGLAFNAHHDPSENFTRLSIWDAALGMARNFPFSGAGPFEFPHVYELVRDSGGEPVAFHAHGILLTIAAETGVIGLAAVLFGWLRWAGELRARLRSPAALERVSVAIAAGLIGTWVQGLIDTSSVVIFALWLPFMALALATAGDAPTDDIAERDVPRRRPAAPAWARGLIVAVPVLALAACAFVQLASDALFASHAAPGSLVARLDPLGAGPYETIERLAPLWFVESALAAHALERGRLDQAATHAARLPPGPARSDLEAQIALRERRNADAIRLFLAAADDEALQRIVWEIVWTQRLDQARALELRIRDRLTELALRPNAVADSWWRLGVIDERRHAFRDAYRELGFAADAAPFNTKYRLYRGVVALSLNDPRAAEESFAEIRRLDPADADAVAGFGLAAYERGDRESAVRFLSGAKAINDRATLCGALWEVMRLGDPRYAVGIDLDAYADKAHDPLAPPRTGAE